HRGRAVGPDPHGMRSLPLLLAHIEVLVARGAAPVDAVRRLARDEAAILPEILARTRTPAPVQSMDDGRRHPARLEDEARDAGRQRVRLAGPPPGCLHFVFPPPPPFAHP